MNLTGNTILITGGASGIGLALACAFLKLDNNVLICARTQNNLNQIKEKHPQITTYCCDISNREQRNKMLSDINDNGYKINVLINNAARVSTYDLSETNNQLMSEIKQEIIVNLISPMELIDDLLTDLKTQINASIININSPAAMVSIAKIAPYSASKAGLLSYSRSLRYFLRKDNIRVIDVFPPGVQTKMTKIANTGRKQMSTDDFANKLMQKLKKGNSEIWIGESNIIRYLSRLPSRWLFNIVNRPLSVKN